MQPTIVTVAAILSLISGAIARPNPRQYQRTTTLNTLPAIGVPSAESVRNCFVQGINKYRVEWKAIDCMCNCGGEPCRERLITHGPFQLDFQFDRILPDECSNAISKSLYGPKDGGERIPTKDIFREEEQVNENVLIRSRPRGYSRSPVTQQENTVPPSNVIDYDGFVKK